MVDSMARNIQKDKKPTEFSVSLGVSGQGLRRIAHRNLQWTQPFWWHSMDDNKIRISFSVDNYETIFVGYVPPFVSYGSFGGDDDAGEFTNPLPGSYCEAIQTMLTTGLRFEGDEEEVIDYDGIYGPILEQFAVSYNNKRGMVISLPQEAPGVDPDTYPVYFRVEKCSWLDRGHHVHGFGVPRSYKVGTEGELGETTYEMEESAYQVGTNIWFSSATPLGMYTRYVTVYSKEICRNRTVTSFTNVKSSGNLNGQELTVLGTVLDNVGVLKNYVTAVDPTVINLREGDALQVFDIAVGDEFGRAVPAGDLGGNPVANYRWEERVNNVNLPLDLGGTAWDGVENSSWYSNDLTTALLRDAGEYMRVKNFTTAKIDSATPVVHYLEVTMF